jgi:predicted phage terminase large subunit-like protein
VANPDFGAVIFRRTNPQIMAQGGLWDESAKVYPLLRAAPNKTLALWRFPSGAKVKFAHLQHTQNIYDWMGSQIPLIGWDQLEHFTEEEFFYLLSRNRSTCGVRPYIRATCNPDAASWLATFIGWWIDPLSGYPIPERAGRPRWFVRRNDEVHWADSPEGLQAKFRDIPPKSVTFIPAQVFDNQILMKADPGYLANLEAQSVIENERLLKGNWKISNDQGEWPMDYFGPGIWFDEWPPQKDLIGKVIALDPSKGKHAKWGDYSAFVMLALDRQGHLWCEADLARRPTPQIIQEGLELYRNFQPCQAFAVETNVFQELLCVEFERAAREQRLMALPLVTIENTVDKNVRIRRLGPYLKLGNIRFKGGSPGTKLLVQQLKVFPNADERGEHDDGPDALEMALRVMIDLTNLRATRHVGRVIS